MKFFFGCTFLSREELTQIGSIYPIKLEYYKTKANVEELPKKNQAQYGIEIIKTSYLKGKVDVEKQTIPEIINDEKVIEIILEKLKQNKVTPISASYVIEDLLKAEY